MNWYEMKTYAVQATGWPMDTLHVVAGVVIQLIVAAISGRSIADPRPWAATFLLSVGNEAHDLWFERWPNTDRQVVEGLRDLLTTILLPTVLLVIARRWPRILIGRK